MTADSFSRRAAGPNPWLLAGSVLAFAAVAATVLVITALGSLQTAFAAVAVFALVLALVFSGNPRLFSLWCLFVTAPLGIRKAFLVRPHMGGASAIQIDGCDPFLAVLLLFILRDVMARRHELRWAPSVAICWGALIVLGLGDVLAGPFRVLALLEVVRMLKLYLLFFVIINEILRARQFFHAVAAIVCGIAMQSIITLIQFVYKANLHLQFLGEPDILATTSATQSVYLGTADVYRAGGLFEHANLLAGYMALLLPICLALMFSRTSPVTKAALGVAVGLGLAALAITLSRSGWMSFGVAFALLFLVSMVHQKLRLRYVLSRILVIAGVVGAVAFESGDILRRVYQSDPGAVKFRWDMIYAALDMIKAHPIFGVGLNTFVAHFPDYSNPPGVEAVNAQYGQLWPVVHDSYLITWTEQGTAGFVFLMALYGGVLWTAAHTARRLVDDRVYAINLGAGCGVVGIMIDGFGSFFIDESASVRVFFLVVGIIYAASYWTRINAPLRASVKAAPEKAPVTHAPVPA